MGPRPTASSAHILIDPILYALLLSSLAMGESHHRLVTGQCSQLSLLVQKLTKTRRPFIEHTGPAKANNHLKFAIIYFHRHSVTVTSICCWHCMVHMQYIIILITDTQTNRHQRKHCLVGKCKKSSKAVQLIHLCEICVMKSHYQDRICNTCRILSNSASGTPPMSAHITAHVFIMEIKYIFMYIYSTARTNPLYNPYTRVTPDSMKKLHRYHCQSD